jgi:hypothetical protein
VLLLISCTGGSGDSAEEVPAAVRAPVADIVEPPTRHGPDLSARETGFDWLTRGSDELPGFSLYSYFLLGSRPTPSTRPRYLMAIAAFLQRVPTVGTLIEAGFEPEGLNVTYIPVLEPPPAGFDEQWVLDNYDFERARFLLASFAGRHHRGPYIFSVESPLDGPGSPAGRHLKQDLSSCSTRLLDAWITVYLDQASRRDFDRPDRMQSFRVGVRDGIARAAEHVQGVTVAIADLTAWINVFD